MSRTLDPVSAGSESTGHLTCRVCGGDDFGIWCDHPVCTIVQCEDCRLVQMGRQTEVAELEPIYGEDYFERGKYVFDSAGQLEQRRRMRWLERCGVKQGGRLLDYGCATGDFLAAAKSRHEAWGIDISIHAIEKAARDYPSLAQRLFACLVDQASLPIGSFRVVTLWDVIEHVPDPVHVISGLRRLLAPDGIMALSTGNVGALTARILKRRWALMTPPEHVSFFNRESLTRLATLCGGRVVRWTSRGKWVNIGFLVRKLRQMFPEAIPARLAKAALSSGLGRTAVYMPSGDIMYAGLRFD